MQEQRLTLVRLCIPEECPQRRPYAIYQCSCGSAPRRYRVAHVETGQSRSCGCLAVENNKARAIHGESGHGEFAEYAIWRAMRLRCTSEKDPFYADYGGRGITVCDEWLANYAAFLRDMGRKLSKTHMLDRIDNNGPYCKANCRWATPKEQGRNKRNSRFLEFRGERLTLSEWSERTGKSSSWIAYRIDKKGMSVAESLSHAFSEAI